MLQLLPLYVTYNTVYNDYILYQSDKNHKNNFIAAIILFEY